MAACGGVCMACGGVWSHKNIACALRGCARGAGVRRWACGYVVYSVSLHFRRHITPEAPKRHPPAFPLVIIYLEKGTYASRRRAYEYISIY